MKTQPSRSGTRERSASVSATNAWRKPHGFRYTACAFALLVSLNISAGAAQPLRALILSGSNNHKWQETTPELRAALEESGRFRCDVVEDVAAMKPDAFAPYDVIVSNFNTFGKKDAGEVWGAAVRAAFLDHIRKGRGFVVFHAGSCVFNDWAEFQQVAGATWGKGTSHGARHAAQVSFCDTDHPVTRGLRPFWTFDEFWQDAGTAPGAKPLAQVTPSPQHRGSGKLENIVFATELGVGRGFCLLLGHDVVALKNAGCRTLLQRGTEWAATGKVTILPAKDWPDTEAAATPDAKPVAASTSQKTVQEILAGVTVWKFGQPREALLACANLVAERSKAPASKEARELAALLAMLIADPQATTDGRKFSCEQLGLIGGAAEVPLLAKLLDDKELSLAARQALEWIPGEASLAAIRAALEKSTGAQRIGLINTLAARRDAKAVPQIAKSLNDADVTTAGVVMDALGRIGGAQAAKALLAAQPPAALRQRWAAALLQCAATAPAERDAIFQKLLAADQPAFIRLAAFPNFIKSLGPKGGEAVLSALASDDKTMQAAAIRALRATRDGALVQAAADRLDKLPPESQVPVITLLGDRGDAAALPALTKAAASSDAAVKLAALAALGLAGNASTVPVLAGAVEGADDETVKVIADSLVRLRGDGVNDAMIAALKTSGPPAQRELIRALAAREAKSAVAVLIEASGGKDDNVRKEAIAALGRLGDKTTCGPLLAIVEHSQASASALVAICRREGTLEPVLAAFGPASAPKKAALLGVLGAVGGSQALDAVRGAAKSDDADVRTAAVRALAGWPDATPLEDLVSLAATTGDVKCKALALRGVANLAPQAKELPRLKVVEFIARAMKAGGVNEQKALLGALGNIAHPAALKLAESCATNPELAAEAKAAIAQIKSGTKPGGAGRAAGPAFTDDVVKLFTSPDNLARGATATNPDGLRPDGQGQGPFAALDGNPSSYWDETDNQKLYQIRVQLRQRATVALLRILGYGHHNYAPRDFEVICDGKVVKKVEGAQYKDNVLTLALPPTECAVVELKITGYYSRSPAIRELGIYGPPAATPEKKPVKKESGLRWERTGTSLAVLNDGQTVWQLNFDPKEGKPYFHPVALPDGTELTWLRPADHVWHRALWWSWKTINGLNYWEEDKKTGLSAGRTDIVTTQIAAEKDCSARIEMELSYRPPDAAPVLREKRVIAIGAPDAAKRYRIDWTSTFTATDKKATLDRTPLPGQPDGKGHGGYAGLSLRMAAATRGWTFTNSDSATGQAETHGKPARWMSFSGKTAGGVEGGMAVFDHPSNARHPSPWYVAAGMPYFSPALLFNEPLTIPAGGSLTLRYRLLVHAGAAAKDALEKEWAAFSKS